MLVLCSTYCSADMCEYGCDIQNAEAHSATAAHGTTRPRPPAVRRGERGYVLLRHTPHSTLTSLFAYFAHRHTEAVQKKRAYSFMSGYRVAAIFVGRCCISYAREAHSPHASPARLRAAEGGPRRVNPGTRGALHPNPLGTLLLRTPRPIVDSRKPAHSTKCLARVAARSTPGRVNPTRRRTRTT